MEGGKEEGREGGKNGGREGVRKGGRKEKKERVDGAKAKNSQGSTHSSELPVQKAQRLLPEPEQAISRNLSSGRHVRGLVFTSLGLRMSKGTGVCRKYG
jgi:hypothetical protein